MASFGENLRREREMRGVTLEEISAATKIGVRLLNCLETEDFEKLPGGIFTRSFIRAYARYLGLDEERVLAEYQLIAQPKTEYDLTRLTARRPDARQRPPRGPVIAVILAAVLLAGGYAVYRYTRRASEASSSPPKPAVATAEPSPASPTTAVPAAPSAAPTPTTTEQSTATGQGVGGGGQPVAAPNAPTPGAPAGGPSAPALPATAEDFTLQVAATERAWVAADADGKTVLQRVLNPGEIETLKAKESFDLTTGNAQGVILTLNGETLKPLGRRGEVKSVHLTRDELKRNSP
ncbi:MAG: DUF4115 domain-containing protein [Acidobacteriia bacterium]|nr:DUF4115 domain-containing protein [Terriglobia bacterium]